MIEDVRLNNGIFLIFMKYYYFVDLNIIMGDKKEREMA